MKLNLGANDRKVAGFVSVDIVPPADQIVDLSGPWPWPDSSVEEIAAFDVVEHLQSRIDFMNQAWRVLIPGGQLHITTPNAAKGGGFFQDPTHTVPWTINSFKYFDVRTPEWKRFCPGNGFKGAFRTTLLAETNYQDPPMPGCAVPDPVYKIEAVLVAVK